MTVLYFIAGVAGALGLCLFAYVLSGIGDTPVQRDWTESVEIPEQLL